MAIWAIGDVQGCYEELRQLIGRIRFDPAVDRLWFVGDLVNRGPGSLETLRWVKSLGVVALTVLGNHDLHLIACAHGFGREREDDTLDAVLRAGDRAELIEWLCGLPLMHVEGSRAMVHAGLLPQWTVARARALATEVEAQLRGAHRGRFLERLYGSRPEAWDDGLEAPDRHRVIVNAMTRMRFCTADGRMDFHAKGEHAPPGYLPWFEVPRRASAGTTVVFGHWSALGLKLSSDLIALDAGCVWGGALTAVRLEDRRVVQVKCCGVRVPEPGDRPSGSD